MAMTDTEILESIQTTQPKKSLNAWLLLVVSLVVFAGLGVFHWDLEYVLLLIVALFIHELGHLLAMKVFRYKNLKMLFLPFIGAAAIGEPQEQNSCKIAWISLFGPLVGFLSCYVALLLWMFTKSNVLINYAYLAVFLNTFNLLPIVPLDGGHFLNETLFSRFPKAELIFRIFALLGLAFLAYDMGSWVFGALTFFTLLTLGVTFQISKATAILRKRERMKGGELTLEKVGQIREEIRKANPRFEDEKNIKGLPNIVGSIWLRINKTFPSIWVTLGLLAAYVFTFIVLPVFTLLSIYLLTGQKMTAQ